MYSSKSNLIIGFHGCDEAVANKLLNNPDNIKISIKPYDWLGHGIYFWENNYQRALEWAKDKQKKGEIKKASVIGAVLTLDYCLDLVDSEFINALSVYYKAMEDDFELNNKDLPKNSDVAKDEHKNMLIRELDCAVIEYMHQKIDEQYSSDIKSNGFSYFKNFDSARGVFTEGGPAFPGAGIQKKSHIQICIRNMKCIKGFFVPRKELLT
jgi:dihydrofolate reductase